MTFVLLKRLFRLAIIVILLVGLSKYTSIFDNTKIKPYLLQAETFVQTQITGIKGWFTSTDTGSLVVDQLSGDLIQQESTT